MDFKPFTSLERYLDHTPPWSEDCGVVFVRQRTTGKVFVGITYNARVRLSYMRSNIKTGKLRIGYFSRELIQTTKDTSDLEVYVDLLKEEQLESTGKFYKEQLENEGLLFKRRRDCSIGGYSFYTATHPKLPNTVYFIKHMNTTSKTRVRSIFTQRCKTLIYNIPTVVSKPTLPSVLADKDEAFIEQFVLTPLAYDLDVTGSKAARQQIHHLIHLHEAHGMTVLNYSCR